MLLFETQSKNAAFSFAVEERLTKALGAGESALMLWRTGKTVMLGRNQVAKAEINEKAVRENGISVVRRHSGGGAIYTDPGVLLYSFITPYRDERDIRALFYANIAEPVIALFGDMGVRASFEGRNDIIVDGRKVSGMAQFIKNGKICSHASLLYEADLDLMASVLNVDSEKIHSKALRSVRSRVANLREFMASPPPMDEFCARVKARLLSAGGVVESRLGPEDEEAALEIQREKFSSADWTYDKAPQYSFKNSRRFPGGRIEVSVSVKDGLVADCCIRGDFLGLSPVSELEAALTGIRYDAGEAAAALEARKGDLPRYLGGISAGELLECMFS